MGQVLHGSATTTEAVRRAIQHNQASLKTLARRYGINQKTVAKWKKRAATARSGKGRVDAIEVRLALRCLIAHCPERWPLEMFWSSAAVDHDIGRAQGCTAAFNGIVRQLRLGGRLPD